MRKPSLLIHPAKREDDSEGEGRQEIKPPLTTIDSQSNTQTHLESSTGSRVNPRYILAYSFIVQVLSG